jgi:hypothetical protein
MRKRTGPIKITDEGVIPHELPGDKLETVEAAKALAQRHADQMKAQVAQQTSTVAPVGAEERLEIPKFLRRQPEGADLAAPETKVTEGVPDARIAEVEKMLNDRVGAFPMTRTICADETATVAPVGTEGAA